MNQQLIDSINLKLEQIASAASAASRFGLRTELKFEGETFICTVGDISRTINLRDDEAKTRLSILLNDIRSIRPVSHLKAS